ncbi:MAG: T9SS type A sorting domain-containing protein [Lentimicrobium sp.]|nr:T9SS type A sorting domain-containing protein [Lentimicrobium sp.]
MKKFILFLILPLLLINNAKSQINGNFIHNGINRSWIVYLPTDFNIDESLPLVLALHGLTQNGQIMMQFSGFNAVADTGNFVVVYPYGVGNAWNVGFNGGSTADDVGFLSALIDSLHQQYNVDLNRVYSTGFSNGGFMSYRLACELGEKVAAIAPVAGTMTEQSYNSCSPEHPMPVLHIHGTNDIVVNYNGGFGNKSVDQMLALWNTFNDCPETPVIENLPDLVAEGSTVQRYTWAPCSLASEVVLLKIINGGHTWPGSDGVTGIGITNRDIIASSEIWNFVKRFSLPNTTAVNELSVNTLNIYPNPTKGKLILIESNDLTSGSEIQIIGIDGRIVLIQRITSNENRIALNVSGLESGLYLIKISGSSGNSSAKLILQ